MESRVDYEDVFLTTRHELEQLTAQRDELDAQIAKKEQLLNAVWNMLDAKQQGRYASDFADLEIRREGLTDAIRRILQSSKEWFTATQMKSALVGSGFDFRGYHSNPLASVHSVLKRLKSKEVENTEIDGVKAWRWKGTRRFPRRKKRQ